MGSMDEDTDVNRVRFHPEEVKFDLTWTGRERPSSSAQLTNPTNRRVVFAVKATDPDNYEAKPSLVIVPPFGSRRINVTARGLPLVGQREGEISVLIYHVPPDCREEEIVFPGVSRGKSPERHLAISCHTISDSVIRVRWVDPKSAIQTLMTKAFEEVSQQNLGRALETLGEAIELRPDGFSLLSRALVNHWLDQKEEVENELQEAELLLPISELAKGTEEHLISLEAYGILSDIAKVPTYTTEKLCGKQMIVKWSVGVTENQQLNVEVRFTPSVMQRSDGNVEVSVIVDSLRANVVSSKTTDNFPHHFLQSLKGKICPTEKWSESFSGGFGLSRWSPGNERNPPSVQQGRSRGFAAVGTAGASPTVSVQYTGNNTSGTTSHAFGLKKSTKDGDAYVFEHEVPKFEDGSSTQNLGYKRYYKVPEIPKDIQDDVSYSKLVDHEGTWLVPKATAMKLRNQFEFTISLEAKLPAVRRCRKSSLNHLFKPPKHELEVRQMKTLRICTFAIARTDLSGTVSDPVWLGQGGLTSGALHCPERGWMGDEGPSFARELQFVKLGYEAPGKSDQLCGST